MPLYLIQGTVEEFYTDVRNGRPTLTVLTIEYYLSSTDGIRKNNVLFKKKYLVSEPITDNSAKSIANAQQVAFGKILAQLKRILRAKPCAFENPKH